MSHKIEDRINYKNRAIKNAIILSNESNFKVKGNVINKTIRHEGCVKQKKENSNALINVIIAFDKAQVNLERDLVHIDEVIPANRSTTSQSKSFSHINQN